jgi:16S rRNA (guanine966-N2)-methyltransferase
VGGLRVIAGSRRGLRLQAPAGLDTRPITDRAKESLFGHLGDHHLLGARVLDLFAGSGAMAIEALSRGAERAVLVERGPAALEVIDHNVRWTRFDDVVRVQRGDVMGFLGGPIAHDAPFSLVFCDPPFAMPDEQLATVLRTLARPGWLDDGTSVAEDDHEGDDSADDDGDGDGVDAGDDGAGDEGDRGTSSGDVDGDRVATVVVRRAKGDGTPPLPAGWWSTWERTFGDTFVAVIAAVPPPGDGAAAQPGGASDHDDRGPDGGTIDGGGRTA